MAQYMILIYESEAAYASGGPELFGEVLAEHNAFSASVDELGAKIVLGSALQPTGTATSVRAGAVTDGPFAETKEALGGYYVIECDNLDQALAVGKRVPARFGGVEIRPLMTFD